MKAKMFTIIIAAFVCFSLKIKAQFYTITPYRDEINGMDAVHQNMKNEELNRETRFYAYVDSIQNTHQPNDFTDTLTSYFSSTPGHEITIDKDIPVFVSVKDSLLYHLIKQRLNICLPLDFISVTSRYGYRKDPFNKCKTFHDGIDLECNNRHVYSMLQGKVVKVAYSKRGYGNHLVVDYGHIQCLYGHLAIITVKEGDEVSAGTILGISGNTGKSTAPHLHIKISARGKSLNPAPFIAYLNQYIRGLQEQITLLRFATRPAQQLNIENLYRVLLHYKVSFPKIVVAQALLETGYFTSRVCLQYNNLFGLRRPSDGNYYHFDSWEESVKAYRDYVQYRYRGGNYYDFLKRIGYAEDPDYLYKVRSICYSL